MAARSDLLRLVRDLGSTEIVLTRRGWPVATLMSKQRWHALHRIIENQADALAGHRFIPGTGTERLQTDGKGRYQTRLTRDAAETLDGLNGSLSEIIVGHLHQLALYGDLRGSEQIERRPRVQSARRGRFRIVWRIDDPVVTVVRIATSSAEEAT
jgi:mRNA-degrading endonuclease RelE of RelBE toxin-antitoxin system